ncbi:MAG: DUF4349 domain-containing protein [Deltaproteobacteria bacterium]|nr:DUF4349 domain-containing protein [Deltaproteobacteria bacterium]MBK8715759.1 DUF4349 domain-containing protein [Deltaproteobacteria bacterium]MBP7288162.1 DUF4349 domain-containing protein [Nannocystaceae bacterium]
MRCHRSWILSLLLVACAGRGATEEPLEATPAVAPVAAIAPLRPAPQLPGGRIVASYVNVAMEVAQPIETAAALQAIAREAGGDVTSLSSSPEQASIYLQLPPEAMGRVRHALAQLPGTIASENASVSDLTDSVRQLDGRLQKLNRADLELERLMRSALEHDLFDAFVAQRELCSRERESLQSQIDNALQQTRRAQLNVTFTRTAAIGGPVRVPDKPFLER